MPRTNPRTTTMATPMSTHQSQGRFSAAARMPELEVGTAFIAGFGGVIGEVFGTAGGVFLDGALARGPFVAGRMPGPAVGRVAVCVGAAIGADVARPAGAVAGRGLGL